MMPVLMTLVIVMRDVNTLPLSVTTMMHVPKMTATQVLDAPITILTAMTMTLVPLILAALSMDAKTLL